ncbi:MAG TPA: hypothetical protein VFI46_03650 [Jiangellaceae bacterium]|nr:hypothetical protein [Jiangellaceae bacterium]
MSGLRRGEACGLRWLDVDLDAAQFMVVQQLVEIGGAVTVAAPKTAASRRLMPLDAVTAAILRWHEVVVAPQRSGPAGATDLLTAEVIASASASHIRRDSAPAMETVPAAEPAGEHLGRRPPRPVHALDVDGDLVALDLNARHNSSSRPVLTSPLMLMVRDGSCRRPPARVVAPGARGECLDESWGDRWVAP